MQKIFTVLFILVSINSFSKPNFEKGNIVNNAGVKTECLIDNGYWENTPKKINYKINAEVITAGLNDIESFEIDNYGKFEKHIVKIAKNQDKIDRTNFAWEVDTLFLRVLVSGNPSLYTYYEGNNRIFFYKTSNDSVPVQLKYKRKSVGENEIETERPYRNQLSFLSGDCENPSPYVISRIQYQKDDFVSAFVEINKCKNEPFEIYKQQKKTLFNISICASAGITVNNITITESNNSYSGSFDNKVGYRIGATLELKSPVYLQNWSFLFEPTFQGIGNSRLVRNNNVWIYQRKEIELNFGVRRYFTLSDKLKLFADVTINLTNLDLGSTLKYNYVYAISKIESELYHWNISSIKPLTNGITIGAGFMYKRFGFAAKYNVPHNLTSVYQDLWKIKSSNFQVIAIVRLF